MIVTGSSNPIACQWENLYPDIEMYIIYVLVVAGEMGSGSYFSDLINLPVQESQDHPLQID